MNYEQMSNNKLRLTGTVTERPVYSHEVCGEEFYETKLSVPRLSGQEDVIPVTLSDRLLARTEVKPGAKISISGQFRSYNKLEGEHSRLLLTAFAREILPADDEVNPNTIEILGYICKPPVYRTTPFKREICDVLLAVNRAYNKSDYIPCIMWGRNARFIKDMPIGERLWVTGRVQSRIYTKCLSEDKSEERVAYEVSVSKILVGNKIEEELEEEKKLLNYSQIFEN
mgnify:FL=1